MAVNRTFAMRNVRSNARNRTCYEKLDKINSSVTFRTNTSTNKEGDGMGEVFKEKTIN